MARRMHGGRALSHSPRRVDGCPASLSPSQGEVYAVEGVQKVRCGRRRHAADGCCIVMLADRLLIVVRDHWKQIAMRQKEAGQIGH